MSGSAILVMICLSVFILFMIIAKVHEDHVWNKGICRESGKPWICFNQDSQGGNGYRDGEGHTCWIMYGCDAKRK